MTNQFVFNQYYIDFIKRLKQVAKKMKGEMDDKATTDDASYIFSKKIMKSIKSNYITLNKSSDEYILYVNSLPKEFWSSYAELDDSLPESWFIEEHVKDVELYENISIESIRKLIDDDYLCHHFLTVFYLFKDTMDDETVKKYVTIFQGSFNKELIEDIENETHKKIIKRLNELKTKHLKSKSGIDMSTIEDTTLGKLAKEILEDVDIDKLQKSIADNGDILKAIGDPDSGFSELITNVSRKMATKISNGELKQENILQDAMKFAANIPGLFGNSTENGSSSSSANKQPDMANMMSMMSTMMNNKEGMDAMKNMMGGMGKPKKNTRQTYDKNAYKKSIAANKLKSKLDRRRDETTE
jgi:hypothetical protein